MSASEPSTRRGDLERDLVTLYPALRRFAAVVGPAEVEPEDLLHDALVAGLARTRPDDVGNLEAYLRRTIVNLASNHRRRLGRARRAIGRLTRPERRPDSYPSDVAELLELSPVARAVVALHDIDGVPLTEVATMLGLTESNARVIASRARRQLRVDHETTNEDTRS